MLKRKFLFLSQTHDSRIRFKDVDEFFLKNTHQEKIRADEERGAMFQKVYKKPYTSLLLPLQIRVLNFKLLV